MNLDPAKQVFLQEVEELLQAMEEALLGLEEQPDDADHMNSVFRAAHTIKGSAGLFGYEAVVEFTHELETELDRVRNRERLIDSDLVAVLLASKDHLSQLAQAAVHGISEQAWLELKNASEQLLARLLGKQMPSLHNDSHHHVEIDGKAHAEGEAWVIALDFTQDAFRNGIDPLSFFRYLATLGQIAQVFPLLNRLPDDTSADPESCYLSFKLVFVGDVQRAQIASVFEFAEDDCDIRIIAPHSKQREYIEQIRELPDDADARLGEILQKAGALTEIEVTEALNKQSEAQQEGAIENKKLGEILLEREALQPQVVEEAIAKQNSAKQKAVQEAKFIRVDSTKLGHLINLVGELVIANAAMNVTVKQYEMADAEEVASGMEQLVEEIRDTALELRMVQIGDTFSRFKRVVRDVSKELEKDIELSITGGATAVDKTVVEKINDPLTHLIRNALDHGIESPKQRVAKGKSAKGRVSLNAYHDSGHIVIEILDDGGGLDPERIRTKALSVGLLRPEQVLSEAEIFRLIFEPGLSTKDNASNLSGRGVGMDVVRRNIEALRGSVELDSKVGQGTKVTIVLPLTLAIIDGFMVGAGDERYVIPLAQVVECVEIDDHQDVQQQGNQYISLRGEVLPYLRVRDFFNIPLAAKSERESLVVVRFGQKKAGLVVDELHGELQTVIKPLGKLFNHLTGISGATVLGNGNIALILDVQGLLGMLGRGESHKAQVIHHA